MAQVSQNLFCGKVDALLTIGCVGENEHDDVEVKLAEIRIFVPSDARESSPREEVVTLGRPHRLQGWVLLDLGNRIEETHGDKDRWV